MSDSMDYWPFDYTRYVEEILPALHLATEGQIAPLQQLIRSGKQQNLSLCSPRTLSLGRSAPDPLPTYEFFALLEENPDFRFDTTDFTWETIERLIAFLPNHHFCKIFELGAELHLALIYAFCSAPMPESTDRWQPLIGGDGDESVWRWQDYFERDEPWRELWEQFYLPPPAAIATFISTPYDPAYPRGLNPFGETHRRMTIKGFLTPDETIRLARELPLRRKPYLSLTSSTPVQEYAMHKWEKHISLSIPDYQERKSAYIQERKKLNWLQWWAWELHQEQWKEAEREEKIIKERLFGHELGQRLMYVQRDFSRPLYAGRNAQGQLQISQSEKPEQENEQFFLVPEEVYYVIDHDVLLKEWIQVHPDEAEKTHRLDWETLWESEAELMRRLDYAISRQWGMLMYYISGK